MILKIVLKNKLQITLDNIINFFCGFFNHKFQIYSCQNQEEILNKNKMPYLQLCSNNKQQKNLKFKFFK